MPALSFKQATFSGTQSGITVTVYIYIYLRCCHFEMSASTAVSPPKKQSWLDERGSGSNKTKNLFLVLLLKGQREALLLLRKRTVSAKVQDLAER